MKKDLGLLHKYDPTISVGTFGRTEMKKPTFFSN